MAKIVLYPTPVTLLESVLWYIKRKKKRKERKKERKRERKKERKKRLILLKIYIFKSKTSEIKSSCYHSGP